ncbi:M24 family metallopeptidase (plasmid) [Pseudonocardia bannensis]|uniref:Aminopeptidase P family protein n=1 Tax=Pseudonocardia bannensis TaxID=630973 RepID=A0A848DMP4_9PSEU|nr:MULTISPECIES: Xaa-Pro peptidase family protein [Pseudonocardia]NMH93766.1 aminopeptidase P family protein [Pseudonocardia bannensis]
MDREVLARQQIAMREFGLDALVAHSPDNVAYGAGYTVPSQSLGMRNRQFVTVCTSDGQSAMLLTANEVDEARDRSSIERLYPYDEFTEDPMAVLAGMLSDLGITDGAVGIELDAFPADRWQDLQRLTPKVGWRPAAAAFARARMVKTEREIALLRESAGIAVRAQMDAYPQLRPGMTEREAYRLVADRALALGADKIVMIQVAAGERSIYSNPSPGGTPFIAGEPVKFDVFVTKEGYLSDTGRSVVVGSASERQRRTWARMQDVFDVIRETIRPGVSTREVWDVFVREFGARSMAPAIRFLGHGLGLSLHEEPFIAAHSDTVLEPGMVFAVEPIFVDGREGYHLEDNLLVTEDGYENLTPQFGRELVEC